MLPAVNGMRGARKPGQSLLLMLGWLVRIQTLLATSPVALEVTRQGHGGLTARVTDRHSASLTELLIKVSISEVNGRWQRSRYRYLGASVSFRPDSPLAPGESREFSLIPRQQFSNSLS
ncbi:MAG: hypothetical protein ACP5U2_15995 [Bryobacteraceae bacterium]